MSAKFMTAILAAGALIASLAASSPVQAGQNDNLKKFVGAAIGLYILSEAIDHRQKGRVTVRQYSPNKYSPHKYRPHKYQRYQRHHRKGHGKWRHNTYRNNDCRGYGNHHRGCWNRR